MLAPPPPPPNNPAPASLFYVQIFTILNQEGAHAYGKFCLLFHEIHLLIHCFCHISQMVTNREHQQQVELSLVTIKAQEVPMHKNPLFCFSYHPETKENILVVMISEDQNPFCFRGATFP